MKEHEKGRKRIIYSLSGIIVPMMIEILRPSIKWVCKQIIHYVKVFFKLLKLKK